VKINGTSVRIGKFKVYLPRLKRKLNVNKNKMCKTTFTFTCIPENYHIAYYEISQIFFHALEKGMGFFWHIHCVSSPPDIATLDWCSVYILRKKSSTVRGYHRIATISVYIILG
jgi:hypothetical protein